MTHDYKRHGTTTLFAALNVLDGKVIGRCMQRPRHQEFIRFLNVTEAAVPQGRPMHTIVGNSATHKQPKVKARPYLRRTCGLAWWFRSPPHWGSPAVAGFATANHAKNQCLLMVAYDAIASKVHEEAWRNPRDWKGRYCSRMDPGHVLACRDRGGSNANSQVFGIYAIALRCS